MFYANDMRKEHAIQAIRIQDKAYPPLLRETHDPPQQLYVRGSVSLLQHPNLLAVVGTRKANPYGRQCVERLLPTVVRAGVPIVSGLALGIDSLAHGICVEHGQPTIAVLGSGIDDTSIIPRSHLHLAHSILESGGSIISEYPPGTPAQKGYFPARNRIIAGLSKAVLVIQAPAKSGALITADLAIGANRDVWAVPGPITDPLSSGTNALIQEGAKAIVSAEDILEFYQIEKKPSTSPTLASLTDDQLLLFDALSQEPTHIDALVALLRLPPQTVSAKLVELEMLGAAEHIGGMRYIRK